MMSRAWSLYWVRAMPFKDVASTVGMSVGRLTRLWSHWGYPKRSPGHHGSRRRVLSDEDVAFIRDNRYDLSQAEMARRLGVSRQRVNQIMGTF